MPGLPRLRQRLTIRGGRHALDDEERPDEVVASRPTVSLVVPGCRAPVARTGIRRRRVWSSWVASGLLFAGMSGGSRTPRHAAAATALFDRARVDASRARWRDVDRFRARAKSSTSGDAGAVGRRLGLGTRWAGRRSWRIATRSGRPRARQGDDLSESRCRRLAIRVDIGVAFMNGSQIVPHVDRRSDLSRTALANDARGN